MVQQVITLGFTTPIFLLKPHIIIELEQIINDLETSENRWLEVSMLLE